MMILKRNILEWKIEIGEQSPIDLQIFGNFKNGVKIIFCN